MSDNFFDSRPNDILDKDKWKSDGDQKSLVVDRKKMLNSQGEPEGSGLNDDKHALFQSFSFWFVKKVPQGGTTKNRFDAYEQGIQCLTTFSTVEDFWANYNHIERPGENGIVSSDFFLFREGIKPMWEDEGNKDGGKFSIVLTRTKKNISKCWEDLLLAYIGGQFHDVPDDEVCGVGMSTRFGKYTISVWTKRGNDKDTKDKIFKRLKKIFLTPNLPFDYKVHDVSINIVKRNLDKEEKGQVSNNNGWTQTTDPSDKSV